MKKIKTFKKTRMERKSIKLSRELDQPSQADLAFGRQKSPSLDRAGKSTKTPSKSGIQGKSFQVFKDLSSSDHLDFSETSFNPKKQKRIALNNLVLNRNDKGVDGNVKGVNDILQNSKAKRAKNRQIVSSSSDELISYKTHRSTLILSSECDDVCDLICSFPNDLRSKRNK